MIVVAIAPLVLNNATSKVKPTILNNPFAMLAFLTATP